MLDDLQQVGFGPMLAQCIANLTGLIAAGPRHRCAELPQRPVDFVATAVLMVGSTRCSLGILAIGALLSDRAVALV